jgi:hypothetical protein
LSPGLAAADDSDQPDCNQYEQKAFALHANLLIYISIRPSPFFLASVVTNVSTVVFFPGDMFFQFVEKYCL